MGKGMSGLLLVVIGILVLGCAAGVYFIVDATAGTGTAVAGIVVVIAGILFMKGSPRTASVGDAEPPAGTQFLCPGCRAVVSIDDASCGSCGKEFVADAFQCPKCRAMVPSTSEECPNCQFLFVEKEYGICPNCKEHIDINATKCPFCAEKIWSALRPPMRFLACPSCRAPVKDADEKCPKCGFKLV